VIPHTERHGVLRYTEIMCGIIGYSSIEEKKPVEGILLDGLRSMEYRGYDSWGVAIATKKGVFIEKKIGPISQLNSKPIDSFSLGIGHTRWATHGGVTKTNAHPHLSSDDRFVVVQNGIVENFIELKTKLQTLGYAFKTQTDTEVIVHLIHLELQYGKKNLHDAVRSTFLQLSGRNTFVVMDRETKTIMAIRQGSPLVVGRSPNSVMLASDTLPLLGKMPEVIFIDDNQLVEIHAAKIAIYDAKTGKKILFEAKPLTQKVEKIDKAGFDHFMIKEIYEQEHTIIDATSYSEVELLPAVKKIKKARHVYTLGAGTAAFAAGHIARFLREINIFTQELRAYEAASYLSLIDKRDIVLVVSQSGETADTLEVVEFLKKKKVTIISIVNMIGSTLSRLSDLSYLSRTGPEICVASTKAYTAQIAWGYLLAQSIIGNYQQAKKQIQDVSNKLHHYFQTKQNQQVLKKLAKKLVTAEHFFVLGKEQHFYSALEAALKIKEITYKHIEGFSAGELKHGVIALIEKGSYIFGVVGGEESKRNETLNALAEVKARGAIVVGIASEPSDFFDIHIAVPDGKELDSITKIIPFQLLAYYLALNLKNNPDKPRSLAKSVTVK